VKVYQEFLYAYDCLKVHDKGQEGDNHSHQIQQDKRKSKMF